MTLNELLKRLTQVSKAIGGDPAVEIELWTGDEGRDFQEDCRFDSIVIDDDNDRVILRII